ncbi:fungal-specific transcription factor domain protein [Aspergillus heteromorphus CBS 117.55]|uniref:Fungal-specific transcription factor domain protein n=1 Tax=Aspergillus heteromorphus CBS 117.55 TaxID=1448321 RepID=A0A317WRT4_9EURO|nr:fungal-specific transcription factor domain protein [Aspergillus heteromorphus CBS 117.55]PWY89164.1 fungal-specific transcription factor domain protein [Aspergillus heteromorphus CBS 117.55]
MEAPLPGKSDQEPKSPDVVAPKPRRRNRVILSCLACRRRKLKCDRAHPCAGCRASAQQCIYVTHATPDAQFRQKLVQLKEAKDALDQSLTRKAGWDGSDPDGIVPLSQRRQHHAAAESDPTDDEEYLEPTPMASQDAAYAAEADNDIDDLGISLGRLRIGERVGGLYRPRIAEEISYSLLHMRSRYTSQNGSFAPVPSLTPGTPESSDAFLKPGRYFTGPSANLVLGPSLSDKSLISFVPPRQIADKLLERYWVAVHPVGRILHRPTFAQRYETLWELVDNGYEVPPSLGAIVCAVLFSAVVSMDVDDGRQVLGEYDALRDELKAHLQLGTEVALGKAQLLKSTKTETLQAFVAYLLAMCLDEVSRAHSVLVGMAIRLAECMGLHRDPTEYDFSPAECQIRRLIWYQICYLDNRTSEIQGPRHFIQPGGFTTKLPFELSSPPVWNEMVFSMMRFECQEMHRKSLLLRDEVDEKKISLTKAIAQLEDFRVAMDNKYGPLLNGEGSSPPQPFRRMAGQVMKLLVSLLLTCFLHRYMNSVTYRTPDRLRQIVLSRGADALEAAVELESADDLRPWAWYSRSYHQYHTAFLLLFEVFAFPLRKEAGRIWRCLDFIFAEPLANLPTPDVSVTRTLQDVLGHREMKGRYLLTLFAERMRVYQAAKGLKLPSKIQDFKLVITPQSSDDSDPRTMLNYAHDDLQSSHGAHDELNGVTAARNSGDVGSDDLISMRLEMPSSEPINELASATGSSVPPPPTQPVLYAQYATPSGPLNDIDAEMLDIDWNVWDTVFPPLLNDGNLDVQDLGDFVWLPSIETVVE